MAAFLMSPAATHPARAIALRGLSGAGLLLPGRKRRRLWRTQKKGGLR